MICTLYAVNTFIPCLTSPKFNYSLPSPRRRSPSFFVCSRNSRLPAEQPVRLLYSNLGTPLSHTLKIKMRYSLAVLALVVAVQASPFAFPGGVTSAVAPPAKPPPGCTPSHASFGIAVLNISTTAKQKRQVSTISEYVPAFMPLVE